MLFNNSLLAEKGLDFIDICSRALINQFEDPNFTKSIIQPAIYEMANHICMILTGCIGLLHQSFIHDHWHARSMLPPRNVLLWVLKLQVKMNADPRKHSFAMYDYGQPFSSDGATAELRWEEAIVRDTTMPGICRQGVDAEEVVIGAEVRMMTASLRSSKNEDDSFRSPLQAQVV
ncbi:hypothetical protein AC579_10225 [Pseudocercospora musae]|uniref:Uncharacterized protein n=1 Tax=Pseudocercospora musae TaxID=113226 RepID=A0A139HE37_9PEZI|nr:hypothetical protein AC579_10225 [Pseudocercospora musae]